jgi:hypothetical protein
MGLRPTPGDEKRGLSLSGYHKTVIPTEAKRSGGTCCSADLSWKCFSTERSGSRDLLCNGLILEIMQ